jgi:hypothetical protein
MPLPVLNEIEREFERLSPDVQLSLLERLLRRVRVSMVGRNDPWEDDLAAMAADPQVRREIDCFHADSLFLFSQPRHEVEIVSFP